MPPAKRAMGPTAPNRIAAKRLAGQQGDFEIVATATDLIVAVDRLRFSRACSVVAHRSVTASSARPFNSRLP